MQQGLEEGKDEAILETIKLMIKKKFSYDDIMEITNKSLDEIKINN